MVVKIGDDKIYTIYVIEKECKKFKKYGRRMCIDNNLW